jgi:integrase
LQSAQKFFRARQVGTFALMSGHRAISRQRFTNLVQRDYLRPESIKAGLTPLGWHALRHSYRTWLAEVGTGPEVQKELMRHSTIAMALDGYGRGIPEENRKANYAVVNGLLQ